MSIIYKQRPSQFPERLDGVDLLMTVRDGLVAELSTDWTPDDDAIYITGSNERLALIPDFGFVSIYLRDAEVVEAGKRAVTVYYGHFNRDEGRLEQLEVVGLEREFRPARSRVVFNVVAAHYMGLRAAVIALERYVGTRLNPAPGTIEHFAQELVTRVKRPMPWFEIAPARVVAGQDVKFHNLTFRLQAWQTIRYEWDFGDGTTSELESPVHVYAAPGTYSVRLTVTNDYGTRTIESVRGVQVISRPPVVHGVTCSPERAIANETEVTLEANATSSNLEDPVIDYTWEAGVAQALRHAPTVRLKFEQGGLFSPRVRATTVAGSFAWGRSSGAVNVIERNTLWALQHSTDSASGSVSLSEWMPIAEQWKTGHSPATTTPLSTPPMNASSGPVAHAELGPGLLLDQNTLDPDLTWRADGGLHPRAGTFEGHWFYGASSMTMSRASYDALTDAWQREEIERLRGWGWQSACPRWRGNDALPDNDVYVMFGSSAHGDLSAAESTIIDVYSMFDQTWSRRVLPGSSIPTDAAQTRVIRWRTSPWREYIYALRSTGHGFNTMFRYHVLNDTFENLGVQSTTGGEVDIEEVAPVTLANGIYFFNHTGRIMLYNPVANTWAELDSGSGSAPQWSDPAMRDPRDAYQRMTATAIAEAPFAGARSCYVLAPYSPHATARYDSIGMQATRISPRPAGRLRAAGVY